MMEIGTGNVIHDSNYFQASTHIEAFTLYGKSLGVIPAVEQMTYSHGLVGMDEISFIIRPTIMVGDQWQENPYYDILTGDMLLKVRNIKSNEYQIFWIDLSNLETLEDGTVIKHIHAFSREYEFSRKVFQGIDLTSRILYYTDGMPEKYKEDSDGIPRGLLNSILPKRGWTVKHIDESLRFKARTVSIGECSEYEVFVQLQEIFDCIFDFDTINKTVSIYDLDLHTKHSGIVLSEKNIINTFSENTNYHDIITRLYIYGGDGLSIAMFSPTGMPYIENFGYYRSPEFMSPALLDALDRQDEKIRKETLIQEYNEERVKILLESLPEANFRIAQIEDELRKMERHLDIIKTQESFVDKGWESFLPTNQYDLEGNEHAWFTINDSATLIAFMTAVKTDLGLAKVRFNDHEYATSMKLSTAIPDDIREKFEEQSEYERSQGGLAGWMQQKAKLENRLDELRELILDRQKAIDLVNCFPEEMTEEERLAELSVLENLVAESVYREESLSLDLMGELIEEGQKKLKRMSAPKVQFTVTAIDFSQTTGLEKLWEHIQLGDIVQVTTDTGFDYPVRLIKVEHMPEEASLTLTFSSGAALYDSAIFLADLLSTANSAAGLLQLGKGKWDDAAIKSPAIQQELQANFDLVKQQLEGAAKQKPVLDERGLWLYGIDDEGNPLPEQVRAINNVIAITQDDWETIDVAITPRGINATTITAGIMNASLIRTGYLQNSDGSIYFDIDNNEFNINDVLTYSPEDGFRMKYVPDEVKEMDTNLRMELGEMQDWTSKELIKVDENLAELHLQDGELDAKLSNLQVDLDNSVTGLEGSIKETANTLRVEAGKIESDLTQKIVDVNNGLNTKITDTSNEWHRSLTETTSKLTESIEDVSGNVTTRYNELKQTLQETTSTISKMDTRLSGDISKISQKADRLSIQIGSLENDIGTVESEISVTQSQISIEVGKAKEEATAGINIVTNRLDKGEIYLTGNTITDDNFILRSKSHGELGNRYEQIIQAGRSDLYHGGLLKARVMGHGFQFYPDSANDYRPGDGGMILSRWGGYPEGAIAFYHGRDRKLVIGYRDPAADDKIRPYITFDHDAPSNRVILFEKGVRFSTDAAVSADEISVNKLSVTGKIDVSGTFQAGGVQATGTVSGSTGSFKAVSSSTITLSGTTFISGPGFTAVDGSYGPHMGRPGSSRILFQSDGVYVRHGSGSYKKVVTK